MLNAMNILAADDCKVEIVEVPEWNDKVGIRIMGGDERDSYECMILKKTDEKGKVIDSKNIRVMLLVNVLCNEKGERIFTDEQMGDLNKKSSLVLDKLFKKALFINGMDEESKKELEKN